jgi:hypothetical protein
MSAMTSSIGTRLVSTSRTRVCSAALAKRSAIFVSEASKRYSRRQASLWNLRIFPFDEWYHSLIDSDPADPLPSRQARSCTREIVRSPGGTVAISQTTMVKRPR